MQFQLGNLSNGKLSLHGGWISLKLEGSLFEWNFHEVALLNHIEPLCIFVFR